MSGLISAGTRQTNKVGKNITWKKIITSFCGRSADLGRAEYPTHQYDAVVQGPVMAESVRAAAGAAVESGRMTADAADSLMDCYMARLAGVTYLK